MIICFQCSSETKEALDQLLITGKYKDYGEIISNAIRNLAVLHEEIPENGVILIGENSTKEPVNKPTIIKNHQELRKDYGSITNQVKYEKINNMISKSRKEVPPVFHILQKHESPKMYAKLPSDLWFSGQEIPLDRWLFGQFNKLLPAKASCRAIARLINKKPNGIDLPSDAEWIAAKATTLGNYLLNLDEMEGINKEYALSTAFPTTSKNVLKSQQRYTNQFVASKNKSGQLSGLLVGLKLINLNMSKKDKILLTEPGWEFTMLENPILDNEYSAGIEKFSNEEVRFLTNHIKNNVPTEDYAYRVLLEILEEGINKPKEIDEVLHKRVPISENRKLSDSFLSSQRSGAISRMADLCLLKRNREGTRVTYKITEIGREYLNEFGGNNESK